MILLHLRIHKLLWNFNFENFISVKIRGRGVQLGMFYSDNFGRVPTLSLYPIYTVILFGRLGLVKYSSSICCFSFSLLIRSLFSIYWVNMDPPVLIDERMPPARKTPNREWMNHSRASLAIHECCYLPPCTAELRTSLSSYGTRNQIHFSRQFFTGTWIENLEHSTCECYLVCGHMPSSFLLM